MNHTAVVQRLSELCNAHVAAAQDAESQDRALSEVLFGLSDTLGTVIGLLPAQDRPEVLAFALARVSEASVHVARGQQATVPRLPAVSLQDEP